MNRNFLTISVLMSVTLFMASVTFAYSRGPHVPQDSELRLPGVLQARDGLNERCEDRRFPCNGRSELVLVKTGTQFEFGNVNYDCIEIDDGAYGALKCTQVGFTTIEKFRVCSRLPSPSVPPSVLSAAFEFRTWFCTH